MLIIFMLNALWKNALWINSADPPRVHLEALNVQDNTVTIVAGNKLRLEIPVSGEPAPRVVWMKGERVSREEKKEKQLNNLD